MNSERASGYRAYIDAIGEDLEDTLRQGLEFIQWGSHISSDSRVFVKPNFTFPHYAEGITTNPDLLKPLLTLLKSKAATVIVGESDGGNHSFKAEDAFKGHDMYDICRDTGAELVNLSTLPSEEVESEICGKKVRIRLPRMLLEEVDCFVSVPVLKVHVITTVSLSLKNSWGCVPDTMRGLHHQNLSHKLALIAKFVRPRIVVVDGTYALNKHGPMFGETLRTNLVLLADNTVLADSLGASVMGFTPRHLGHLKVAEKAGLGSLDLSQVEINKEWTPYGQQFEVRKTLIDRLASLLFYSDALARIVMNSPLTPLIYRIATRLRTTEEKGLAEQLGGPRRMGPY